MRINWMRQREPRPALPDLERDLVDMAGTQAEAGERRSARRLAPRFALGAAVAALGVALGLSLFGESGKVRPERASAAEFKQVAAMIPRLGLAGPWQIVSTELLPNGGRIDYLSEEEDPRHFFHPIEAEIRWRSTPLAARAAQLESEGLTFARSIEGEFSRPEALVNGESDRFAVRRPVRIFAAPDDGEGDFLAAGLWRAGGRTFEYRADVLSLAELRYLMQRIELLGRDEWFIALQSGGGRWLAETAGGTIRKVIKIQVGQTPDGRPIYREGAVLESPLGEKREFKSGLPTIYREGDRTRVVVEQPPEGLELP